MKCDELKPCTYDDMIDGDADTNIEYYPKSDADAIIAQKDFEIDRLKEFNAFIKQRISNGDVGCSIFLDDLEQKDKEIAELKQKLENVNELVKESKELLKESQKMHKRCADNAIKQLRHQKFKRCLAMVKYCDMGLTYYNEKLDSFSCERADFFYKWYNRWWKIAEKFKEAK